MRFSDQIALDRIKTMHCFMGQMLTTFIEGVTFKCVFVTRLQLCNAKKNKSLKNTVADL